MTQRQCIICRRVSSVEELTRLRAQGQRLCIESSAPRGSRSVWLCYRRSCCEKLTKHPARAGSALRCKISSAPNLWEEVQEQRWKQVQRGLRACMRSGLIILKSSGSFEPSEPPRIATVWSLQSDQESKVQEDCPRSDPPVFRIPVSEEALGATIGRPRCKQLGIREGKPSRHLLRQLHLFVEPG